MEFLKIENTVVKSPTSISVSTEILDKAERTMDGTMVIDVIGRKQMLEAGWDYLSKTNMSLLSSLVSGKSFVTVSYIDKSTGTLKTITARPKDLSYQLQYDWTKDLPFYKGVSVSFEER